MLKVITAFFMGYDGFKKHPGFNIEPRCFSYTCEINKDYLRFDKVASKSIGCMTGINEG